MKDGGNRGRGYSRELSNSSASSNFSTDTDSCDKINFPTQLQNIQPSVVKYNVDDILRVELDIKENVIVTSDHGVCGTITSMEVTKLRECIKKGKTFKAVIVTISSSSCEVVVRPLTR